MIEIRKRFDLEGHRDSIYALDYAINGKDIFTAGNDGLVIQWDANTGEGKVVAKADKSIYCIKVLDESTIAIGENHKGIRLLDLKSKNETKFYPIENLQIFDILITEDQIIAACSDGWLFSFDKLAANHKKIQFSKKNIRTICLGKDNSIIVGYSDQYIRIHDLNSLRVIQEFIAHEKSVFKIITVANNKWLLSVGRDALIKIWGISKDYGSAGEIPAHHFAINSVALSNDEKHFVTCSMDKTLKIWNTNTGKLLKVIDSSRFEGHKNSVNNVNWINGETIASVGDDNRLIIWQINGLD